MMKFSISGAVCIAVVLTSCYSFDKQIAIEQFKGLKPNCRIVDIIDYECDGTLGGCWYVRFKYKSATSNAVYDTTLQYWKVDGKWLTSDEFKRRLPN